MYYLKFEARLDQAILHQLIQVYPQWMDSKLRYQALLRNKNKNYGRSHSYASHE